MKHRTLPCTGFPWTTPAPTGFPRNGSPCSDSPCKLPAPFIPRLRRASLVLCVVFAAASPARADVLKIVVDGPIHPIVDEYIGRALDQAAREKSEALLIELRTPGGLVDSTRNIVTRILASPVPVIVYVAPTGSRSASAGFYILESADVAAMAPGTNTGAAHPVTLGAEKMDPVMKEKLENDSAAFMRSFVLQRGRNLEVAESGVRQSKSFTDQEALQLKLIEFVVPSQAELLKQLDGKSIKRFDGSTTVLHLAGRPVRTFPLTLKQQILGWLMDPNVTAILFAIGMLALYAEFNHPGAVVPGVIGLIFIVLAISVLNILPTSFAALGLMVSAFLLFGLEAKFQTHGVLGMGGVVALFLGALLLVDGPIPEMRVRWLTALGISLPLGAITIFLMSIAMRARRNKIFTGAQGLVGEVGTARTSLLPAGKVFVHGAIWDAVSPLSVDQGEKVVVVRAEGLLLEVAPLTPAAPRA